MERNTERRDIPRILAKGALPFDERLRTAFTPRGGQGRARPARAPETPLGAAQRLREGVYNVPMTAARLTRTLRREVVRPILRTKRELLRTICSGGSAKHSDQPRRAGEPSAAPTSVAAPVPAPPAASPSSGKQAQGRKRTKAELYEEAVRRDIPGRSTMNKAQLEKALGLE
ncbi:MAG: hypothetical protein Q7T55_23985 [Solirubrobacteraceae bacterium]|nr:hypothetical protein [Solirubrobacteraceae bacterium]